MRRLARWAVVAIATVVLSLSALVATLWQTTSARVREIPFSTSLATGVVGADWAERYGYAGEPVDGEVEEFGTFSRLDFDADAVDPEIRRFYERTANYDMGYTVEWHRGFRLGAWLASFATTAIGQLNLPGRSDDGVRHLESRLASVPDSVDPRDSVVWTRTDPASGAAVFVAIYARHTHQGVTYANVAVPLPFTNLSTVLRPRALATASRADDGVEFTTEGPGDGGLYLVTPLGPLDLPMAQSFRVWPADAEGAPASPTAEPDLVATHEMWLCGRQFLTITYGIERSIDEDGPER